MITAENEIASRTPGEAAAPAGAQGNKPVGPRHGKAPKKPGLSKRTRGIVTAAVIVAVVCAVAFSVWFFLFRDKKDSGAAITEIAQLGSIQSRVEGEGNAMAGASAALTTQANCIIGDVRRFQSKKALVGFAGIDPPPNQSGKFNANSRSISKRGSPSLRRTLFLVVGVYLQRAPADEPVYQFMCRKRAEGKPYKVYMMASANKFLRVYYAIVKAYLDRVEQA